MNPAPAESKAWSRQRWVVMFLLILSGQVGCIFWLASSRPNIPPPPASSSTLYFPADQVADLPGVSDPTLFVLPNAHGFSGPAWIQFPTGDYALEPWTEPPRPLELELRQLGAPLRDFVQTNQPRPFDLVLKPEPELEAPGYLTPEEPPSSFTIEGSLADRTLLTSFDLKSFSAADILTPSEVQVAVDTAGRVFSAALIGRRCASADANAFALSLARSARFEPLRWVGAQRPAPGQLSWGKIVFQWHTTPLPAPTGTANK